MRTNSPLLRSSSSFTCKLALLPLLAVLTLSCSDDDDGGDGGDTTTVPQTVEVCGEELECGADCTSDNSCPDGQHCAEDNKCYAECTESAGCNGPCTDEGRCDGTRQMTVSAPSSGGGDDAFISDDDAVGGSGGGNLESCATSRDTGELTPVSMFVMFDNSLSMDQQNKWDNATEAMNAFFRDPSTGGMGIALRFFDEPNGGDGCNEQACDNDTVASCAQPEVPLGTLSEQANDAQESALIDAVNGQGPTVAGTPLYAALSGATQWAVQRQDSNTDEQVVVLFVTDGVPRPEDSCPADANSIAEIAGDALAEGVLTYAIGLEGSEENMMNTIASAGGTQAIFIDGQNTEQDLLAALNQIRGEVASCDIVVPQASNGQTVDTGEVNVTLTLASGETELGQVPGPNDCEDLGAWYYNDNESRILLCPAACDAVTDDPRAQIDIVLGCETSVRPGVIAR